MAAKVGRPVALKSHADEEYVRALIDGGMTTTDVAKHLVEVEKATRLLPASTIRGIAKRARKRLKGAKTTTAA